MKNFKKSLSIFMALCMMPVSVQCISAFATADSLAKLEEDVTAFDGKLSVAEPDDTREQAKLRRRGEQAAQYLRQRRRALSLRRAYHRAL